MFQTVTQELLLGSYAQEAFHFFLLGGGGWGGSQRLLEGYCKNVHTSMHAHTHQCTYENTCTFSLMFILPCTHACMHTHMYACMHIVKTFIYLHSYMKIKASALYDIEFRQSDVSPGRTELKQGKFVKYIFTGKGYFRETKKSQNINPISPTPKFTFGIIQIKVKAYQLVFSG